jgi:hypothetical protein
MDRCDYDFQKSNYDFERLVLPIIEEYKILKGRLSLTQKKSLEDKKHLCSYFDRDACIDLIQTNGSIVRGIAVRFQEVDRHDRYESFTIRNTRDSGYKTEYSKVKEAIQKGDRMFPELYLQAYVNPFTEKKRFCWQIGIAKTVDIYHFIDNTELAYLQKNKKYDQNTFWVLKFVVLRIAKRKSKEFKYGEYKFDGFSKNIICFDDEDIKQYEIKENKQYDLL